MRISTQSLFRSIQRNILRQANELKKIEEKVASGKNMNRLSDDPVALVSSLGLRNTLERIGQYQRNMDMGKSWLDLSTTVIKQGSELADRAQKIATELSTGTQTAEMRASLSAEISEIMDEAVGLGNTQLSGKYIFAGYQTGTAPFSKTTSGGLETVQYAGDTNNFQIAVGPNESLTLGKNGQEVWVDSGLFTSLGNLKQAIDNNDLAGIQQQAVALQSAEDYLNAQESDVGIRQNRLQRKQEILSQLNLTLQNQLDGLENADYNEVIVEMQQQQKAYEIALEASAMVSQVSLLDYLQ
jgi:flagellar hook-associated protein 3 FlgL